MSVSQVKKRFGEFESYLRNDKEGLRRLKLLKDDVNVLRTSLAAAEEKAELAEVVKLAARERADKAEDELAQLKLEMHQLNQRVSSLVGQLALAMKPEKEPIDKDETDRLIEVGDHVECKRMLKNLRRVLPKCPRLRWVGKSPVFTRQEFAEGWSHQSIWTIGASVAILAAHEGSVTVIDPAGVIFEHDGDKKSDGLAFNFIRWNSKNIDFDECKKSPRSGQTISPLKPDKNDDPQRTTDFLSHKD